VLDGLRDAGAEVREIVIPELGALRTAHLVTIVGEMSGAHAGYYDRYRTAYGHETRINLALARRIPTLDYVHAQRLRARLARHFADALRGVDVVATPSTGRLPPVIPEGALQTGISDVEMTTDIMRFAPAANLLGLPAISFPAGHDAATGLPVGFQAMGRPWSEALLLRLAAIAERFVERRPPRVHRRLLST
jgi:Asp-tRNA(Asn)/Glu-tRNA(Gln) amidotransferase A subunit family amidase